MKQNNIPKRFYMKAAMLKKEYQSAEKSFSVVLLIITYLFVNSEDFRILSLVMAIIFLLLAFTSFKTITPPSRLWFKFKTSFGSIIAPIVEV